MVQRDPWASSAIGTVATGAEFKSASDGGAQRVNRNAHDVRGSFSSGKMAAGGRPRFNPDVALESARKRVAGLEAAISFEWVGREVGRGQITWQRPSEAHKRLSSRSR